MIQTIINIYILRADFLVSLIFFPETRAGKELSDKSHWQIGKDYKVSVAVI